MKYYGRLSVLTILCCAALLLLSSEGLALQKPPKPKLRSDAKKKHKYIANNDINNDGRVDQKDRLLMLQRKDGKYDDAYVSTEDEDMLDIIDIDGDGSVESWEIEGFYDQYDTNGDGVLQDEEIEAATD